MNKGAGECRDCRSPKQADSQDCRASCALAANMSATALVVTKVTLTHEFLSLVLGVAPSKRDHLVASPGRQPRFIDAAWRHHNLRPRRL